MLKYFLFLVVKPTVTDYAIVSDIVSNSLSLKELKKLRIEVKQAMMFNVQKQFGNFQSCSNFKNYDAFKCVQSKQFVIQFFKSISRQNLQNYSQSR
jgi:hypothetical protein